MILSKQEAICLVLGFSKNQKISSTTKLNKLLAKLNLHFIPFAIDFSLNKYGSFNADLGVLETNQYYERYTYEWKGKEFLGFELKEDGRKLLKETTHKIHGILKLTEIEELRNEICFLSELPANEISGDEHKKLLVDIDVRYKLIERINTVYIDMFDLYQEIDKINQESIEGISLAALIEYCFNLSKYLKEKRFKDIEESGYDFDAYMFDYYFLYNLEQVIPILNEQLKQDHKDGLLINKYYQYFVNSVKGRYPFSLENPNLNKLVA